MKKSHVVQPSAADKKFVGEEPFWDPTSFDHSKYVGQLVRGLNWHNYVARDGDLKKYVVYWVATNLPEKLSVLQKTSVNDIDSTIAALCRMNTRGFPLKEHHLQKIHEHIEELSKKYKD